MILVTGGAGFIGSNLVGGAGGARRARHRRLRPARPRTRNGATSPSASSPRSSRPRRCSSSSTRTPREIEAIFHHGRHLLDHRDRRRSHRRDQFHAVAAAVGLVRRAPARASSTPPRPRPMATARPGSTMTARRRRWPGCGRSTPMAGRSISSIAASPAWSSADAPRPPQWAGLKFFNVYGPNEYHKGDDEERRRADLSRAPPRRAPPRLFRSHRADVSRWRAEARLRLCARLRRR